MKFDLPDEMVNVISQALGNAPFRVALPVIQEMQRQIDLQKVTGEQISKLQEVA